MIGNKYTKLTVVEQVSRGKFLCACDCGGSTVVPKSRLESGNTKSCGCLRKDVLKERNTTHGMSDRPEYSHWKDMLKRCFNKNNKRYEHYAGRGISVHEDFVTNFPAWLDEIGPKPDDGQRWSVGRKDNDGWYTYGNMRWELDAQQARNHTLQSNNTSGIVGVRLKTNTIAGKEYQSWVAVWCGLDGKKNTKEFSTNKYGYDTAKQMAISLRKKMIEELNACGADYAETHGLEK